MIPSTLDALKVDIATLKPYAANPRNGDIDAIAESLRFHGQYRPIVVRKDTNEILAGNHTYAAAMQLGWTELAATFVDVSDDQAARIVVVDNRLNDRAKNDDGLLAELLQGLPDLAGTGYDDVSLGSLIRYVEGVGGTTDEWIGMPDHEQGELKGAASLTVHFPTDADADDFFRLIGRPRARTLWWPEPDGHKGSDIHLEYVADE